MSIDARVETVIIDENGGGRLKLIDRPARSAGDNDGIAGQNYLSFDSAPEEVTALNGLDIWGGDSQIMLGDSEIAKREGYGGLAFVGAEEFKRAVAAYHARDK
jgi:hypothetical protein